MSFKKGIQITLLACSLLMLAACSTGRNKQGSTSAMDVEKANAAYRSDARSSGIGEESRFGYESTASASRTSRSAKRTYYFDFDSNIVHGSDKSAIGKHAEYLTAHPKATVMLEGHTDPRGSREYNIGLGERRAKAIAEQLAADGVKPSQIRLVSYGAEKRAARGSTEGDYQKDRRVVLVYYRG